MRKTLIGFLGLIVAAVLGAYLWTRSSQQRIVEAMDLAVEETERLWSSEFTRQSIFRAPAEGEEVLLPGADETSDSDAEEGGAPNRVDPADATSYYRQVEEELKELPTADRLVARLWLDPVEPAEPDPAMSDVLEKHTRTLTLIEKGLAQNRCSPWDTPLNGIAIRSPNPEIHSFVAGLFLARAWSYAAQNRHEEAVADILRVIAYAQDLSRYSTFSTRFHFSALEGLAARRLQTMLAGAPISQGAFDRALKALVVLDEIQPPPSQTIQLERLVNLIDFGQTATSSNALGRVPFWASVFDFTSTHHLADAAETTRLLFGGLEQIIDQPIPQTSTDMDRATAEITRSSNPVISNVMPNLERFQILTLDTARQLRIAQLAAGLQLYRLEEGDFPQTLAGMKGKTLRRIPTDPLSGEAFQFRPPDEGAPAKLSTAEGNNQFPDAELPIEATMRVAPPEDVPASLLGGKPR